MYVGHHQHGVCAQVPKRELGKSLVREPYLPLPRHLWATQTQLDFAG